jgi:hypothetical protein
MPENCQRAFGGTKPILSPDLIQEGILQRRLPPKAAAQNPVKKETPLQAPPCSKE